MAASEKGTALITDGSTEIGMGYADRLARRGHDLILVCRHRGQLDRLAGRLGDETGRSVRIIDSDLTNGLELARIEEILCTDKSITVLVNNAGMVAVGLLLDTDINAAERMVELNITTLVRLVCSVAPAFIRQGGGAIINVASASGPAPDGLSPIQGGVGAFLLAFSLSLQKELAGSNIHVQVVLPSGPATIARHSGRRVEQGVGPTKDAGAVVDAAFAGFDRGEFVTFPGLPEITDLNAYEAMRQTMISQLLLGFPTREPAQARA